MEPMGNNRDSTLCYNMKPAKDAHLTRGLLQLSPYQSFSSKLMECFQGGLGFRVYFRVYV